jgi:hypothetical protein
MAIVVTGQAPTQSLLWNRNSEFLATDFASLRGCEARTRGFELRYAKVDLGILINGIPETH